MAERDDISEAIGRIFPGERRDLVIRFVREAVKVDEINQIVALHMGNNKRAPQPSIVVIFNEGVVEGVISRLQKTVCPDISQRDWVLGLVAPYASEKAFREEMSEVALQRNYQINVLWNRPSKSAQA